jgi:UPF0176 protein
MKTALQANAMAAHNQMVIAAFYKFYPFPTCAKAQLPLKKFLIDNEVKGTVLVSPEGINGTISGSRAGIDAALAYLRALPGFADLEHKESFFDRHPFERTKVKHKKELVSLGVPTDPTKHVGTYIEPKDWNAIINSGIPVIDTRNEYEYHIGTFKGAINPDTKRFRQMADWTRENFNPNQHKEIAMFCTGGIRCEKYSAHMLDLGFEKVYHLKGGVLKYLEEIPQEKSTWDGECYVFDERVAVGHGLEPTTQTGQCRACGHSLITKDRVKPEYIHGKQCPFCA